MHVPFKIHYRNNFIDKKDSYLIPRPPSWDDRNCSYGHQFYPSVQRRCILQHKLGSNTGGDAKLSQIRSDFMILQFSRCSSLFFTPFYRVNVCLLFVYFGTFICEPYHRTKIIQFLFYNLKDFQNCKINKVVIVCAMKKSNIVIIMSNMLQTG